MILLVLVILAGVTYRAIQVAPYPMGGGRYEVSPNGQYEAHAFNMYDEDFWGFSRSFYAFEVHDKSGRVMRSIELPQPANGLGFRGGKGQIMWAADSRSVSFGTPQ
ncbi:MAG: hypothetical protein MJA84_02030 [Firmicutes bacterium]|nr:hypothetical protein [Bacillota bacterium]